MQQGEKSLETGVEAIADACFAHLVSNPEDLQRFMAEAGYTPHSIQSALGSPALSFGMIEFFVKSEPLLLAMCANHGLSPDKVMSVWRRMNPES